MRNRDAPAYETDEFIQTPTSLTKREVAAIACDAGVDEQLRRAAVAT